MTSKRLIALALLGAAACLRSPATVPVEAGVTFATHPEDGGFVVDRLRGGEAGVLSPPGWLRTPNAPTFVLRSDDGDRAALWLVGRSRVIVRGETSIRAPRTGEVISSWDDGAIRLALWSRDGSTLQTDTFRREGDGTAPPLLGRAAQSLDGTYRATVRDREGAAVGWIQVRIEPDRPTSRAYDAVLPPGVEDGLAAAATVALDGEIGWIEQHAVNGSGGAR
ncbi:MAG TPA: hypothetical protein VEM57_04455 [Candidatus Binatus sp.]|nr:hypothetical protein [Candidatus Binatus sp.]